MGDGAKTQFWEDTWIDQSPLAIKFHRLYNTTFTKHVIVKQIKDGLLSSIQFRIYIFLHDETADQWQELCEMVNNWELTAEPDTVKWY